MEAREMRSFRRQAGGPAGVRNEGEGTMARQGRKNKTIMVINDDPAILGLFEDLLGEEGYDVVQDQFGKSTQELHQSIRDIEPDLIILDYIIGR